MMITFELYDMALAISIAWICDTDRSSTFMSGAISNFKFSKTAFVSAYIFLWSTSFTTP